jgi:hypothetical protein
MSSEPKAITILDLARFRGAKSEMGAISGSEFERVGLAMMGGCRNCGATIAAYNACPTKSGNWTCLDCVDGDGFETVEEADKVIFGGLEQEIFAWAKAHGEESDPDHEVGDLQEALRDAMGRLSVAHATAVRDAAKERMLDWKDEE